MVQEPSLIEQVARLSDRLEVALANERRTRVSLIHIHAWKAIIAGLLVLGWGAPPQWEDIVGLWIQPFLGLFGVWAGITLLVGLRFDHAWRPLHWLGFGRTEIGLAMVGLWDLAMGLTVIAAIAIGPGLMAPTLPWPLGVHDAVAPRPYPSVIYFALALMVWGVHLRAVITERRIERHR